jgi:hypothetical protein
MKVRLEFQYFEDCPHHDTMRMNLYLALQGIENNVELTEVQVADADTAARLGFRGSPTLLINGEDVEGMPAPEDASLSCRFYPNGVPSAEVIRRKVEEARSKE